MIGPDFRTRWSRKLRGGRKCESCKLLFLDDGLHIFLVGRLCKPKVLEMGWQIVLWKSVILVHKGLRDLLAVRIILDLSAKSIYLISSITNTKRILKTVLLQDIISFVSRILDSKHL